MAPGPSEHGSVAASQPAFLPSLPHPIPQAQETLAASLSSENGGLTWSCRSSVDHMNALYTLAQGMVKHIFYAHIDICIFTATAATAAAAATACPRILCFIAQRSNRSV